MADMGDAMPKRAARAAERDVGAGNRDPAARGLERAAKDVHKGALACAVFAHEAMHLVEMEGDIDLVQRPCARELHKDIREMHRHVPLLSGDFKKTV